MELSERHQSTEVSSQGNSPETAPTKPRVLVVASERVISDTLAMVLNQSGFHARALYSGEEAVEAAPVFKPDVLLSDVIMFGLNGIETAIHFRDILPSTRILLFSGSKDTPDLMEKAHVQGHDFEIMGCPVHPQELLNRLSAPEDRLNLGSCGWADSPRPTPEPPPTSNGLWRAVLRFFTIPH